MAVPHPPRKFSDIRKSSVHKNFIFTVEGAPATGWETDVRPPRAKTWGAENGFIARKFRSKTASVVHPVISKVASRSRLLLKNGLYNIIGKNIPQRRERFFSDFWNTLIDMPWSYVFLFFLFSLISSWLFFGVLAYVAAYVHGDLEYPAANATVPPCVVNVRSFAGAFLYSMETMHTIGYGSRYPTEQCPFAIVCVCLSALMGCVLEALIVGVVFAKFQMPAQRAQTLMFSRNAIISVRDGRLCLLFRIGNMRKSLIIQLAVKAHLVHHRMTREQEMMPFHQHELVIQLDSMSGNAFSSWPVTACHKIDPGSPIYDLSRKSLERAKFEIIVALEGIVENTGAVVQARTSYTPEEIIWGHMFTRLLTFRREKGEYVVDFNHFQTIEPVRGMTGLSGRELDEQKSLSDPESYERENEYITFGNYSPSLARAVTASNLRRVSSCGHEGFHACNHGAARRVSRTILEAEEIKEIFRPPDPSLARATSTHTMESLNAMAREYEVFRLPTLGFHLVGPLWCSRYLPGVRIILMELQIISDGFREFLCEATACLVLHSDIEENKDMINRVREAHFLLGVRR